MKILTKFTKFFDPNLEVAEALEKDLADISLMMETEIANRTPVDTGRLKGSMAARPIAQFQHEVATNVEYAYWVEYGTGRFAGRFMMRRGAAAIEAFGTTILTETLRVANKKRK